MPSIKIPKRPNDFIDEKGGWGKGVGQRFRAFMNNICDHNGSIPSCAGRDCEFYRRGECWKDSVGVPCVWPYYWLRIDDDGNALNRDGFVLYTKEEMEKYQL